MSNGDGDRSSTARTVGAVLLLGAIGVGGYLFYDWYKKKGCSDLGGVVCIDGLEHECVPWPTEDLALLGYLKKTGNTCTSECVDGATKCEDDVSYVCEDGDWAEGGDACGETPVLCIEGATRCTSGSKVQCQDNTWSVIGECVVADCLGISCISSQVLCDEDDTAYYQIACDPRDNTCKPTMYLPDADVCKNAGVSSITVNINGASSPVILDMEDTCGDPEAWNEKLARYPDLFWNIKVKDAYGRLIEGARIKIVKRSSKSVVGFIDPTYYNEETDFEGIPVSCGIYQYIHERSYTDENGEATIRAFIMFTPDTGSIRTETFDVYVIYKGKTTSTSFQIQVLGSSYGENDQTCHGTWLGGDHCRLD